MEWWGWVLVVALLPVALLLWVVLLAVFDALTDAGSDRVLGHPAVADRITRRPGLFRIGGVLVALGLVPVVAMLGSLLRERYDPDPGVMPVMVSVAAGLIALGSGILVVWWRLADPGRSAIE